MIQIIDSSTWLSIFMRIHQQFNQKIHVFSDARSRFGDARRGPAPTASRHAQWSSAVKARFWGSTLKFTVKSLKWYTYISTKCHENMVYFLSLEHDIGFWEKTNPFMIIWWGHESRQHLDQLLSPLGLVPHVWLESCKGCKAGIISYGDNTFFCSLNKGWSWSKDAKEHRQMVKEISLDQK